MSNNMKNYEIVKEALWGRSHKYNFQQMTNVAESTKTHTLKVGKSAPPVKNI